MIDNLIYMMQTSTVEQLKLEIEKNVFVDKNLKDFNKGKEVIDKLIELSNVQESVKYYLLLYCMYKMKGGK
jgi:hypothetical protein